MRRPFHSLLILLTAATVAGSASAQARDDVPPLSIRVTGEARVTAAPDQVTSSTSRPAPARTASSGSDSC